MSFELHTHLSHKQKVTVVDRAMMVVSIIQPLATIPQVIKIWTEQSAAGVSLWTWLGFSVIGVVFLLYGIMHKLRPFILNQILWFMLDALVVISIIVYS